MTEEGKQMTDSAAIGKRVEFYRTQKKISQDELAIQLDVSQQSISDIERGKTEIKVTQMLKIADILGISPEKLYTDDNAMSIDARNSTNTSAILGANNGTVNFSSAEILQALLVEKQQIVEELKEIIAMQKTLMKK
jgi:transcriptional regulator with XRE-family HTH domain